MSSSAKRRNSEKRKEKSRDAARCRRSKETEIFTQLAKEIPMYSGGQNQLDKASVMRLAISHLKMRKIMERYQDEDIIEDEMAGLYPKALEGFLLLLSADGDIIYVSDTVGKYLGIPQVDLMGQSIFDFTHPRDHDEVTDIFSKHHGKKENNNDEGLSFFMRVKCTLTSKGKNVNLKSASYKVLKFFGKMMEDDAKMKEGTKAGLYPFLLLVGEPIPHPANIEIKLDGKIFLTRHNMDMTFTYCDERMQDLIGFECEELMDQSLYSYHHAADSEILDKAYKDMFAKGQTETGTYRFLAKGGGYVWVVTQGTVITNSRTQKPQCVVCVHYVLSNVEDKGIIISEVQNVKKESKQTKDQCEALPAPKSEPIKQCPEKPTRARPLSGGARPKVSSGVKKDPEVNFGFKLSTEDVFANSKDFGFILSTENVLKPLPQNTKEDNFSGKKMGMELEDMTDLTHLAPTAGDVCIPLPCNLPPYLSNQQPPSQLNDQFSMKQEPDLFPKSICRNSAQMTHMRSNPNLLSPHSLSPAPSSVSPALLSPISSPGDYQNIETPADLNDADQLFSSMEITNILNHDENEADLDMRAPYIPMNAEADFSLVGPTTDAYFNLNNDFDPALFGRTETVFTSKDKIIPDPPKEQRMTLRDMLGESTAVAAIEQIPETRMMQMKRPLDMNSLEKGPPMKVMRQMVDLGQTNKKHMSTSRPVNSVLMNLLMNGEDRSSGYSVKDKLPYRQTMPFKSGQSLSNGSTTSLPCITPQEIDATVTPNTIDGLLLQGQDLMHYLESLMPRSSLL